MRLIRAPLLLVLASVVVRAEPTVTEYAAYRADKAPAAVATSAWTYFITGVGSGFVAVTIEMIHDGKPLPYCAPETGLNADNYMDVMDAYLARNRHLLSIKPALPLSTVLLWALESKFPCAKVGEK